MNQYEYTVKWPDGTERKILFQNLWMSVDDGKEVTAIKWLNPPDSFLNLQLDMQRLYLSRLHPLLSIT